MPLISTTIDAFSPFIDYQPQGMWREGGADGDPYASRYEDKTFMLSIDAPGATATFNFTGTEVHVYGAYRCNSGPYSVTIDGTKSEPMRTNGSAPSDVDSQLFQVKLFAAIDLTPGVHQVVLTNEWSRVPANKSGSAFDVDFITFTSSVESADTATIQSEQDEFFSFAPESAWAQVRGSDYNGGSEHLTVQSDTSISLSFAGDRVALYGTYGSDYAIYGAQLDDVSTSIMNASRPIAPLSQQLLFQATGLEKGVAHNLTLTSLSRDGAKFAVDYAEVDGASNAAMGKAANTTETGGEAAATASESAGKTGSETRLSPGSVAGIVAGSIAGVMVLLVAVLLLQRHSRRRTNGQSDMRSTTQPGITPYFIATETWRDSNSEVARSSSPWLKSQHSMPSSSPSSSKFAVRQEVFAYSPATSSYDLRGITPRMHTPGPDTSHLPPPSYASL